MFHHLCTQIDALKSVNLDGQMPTALLNKQLAGRLGIEYNDYGLRGLPGGGAREEDCWKGFDEQKIGVFLRPGTLAI